MITISISRIGRPSAVKALAWLTKLATRLLAGQLQMPEPLLRDAARYLHARLDVFERRLAAMMSALR